MKRLTEMFPGLLMWGFIFLFIVLSYTTPLIATFIIVFFTVYFTYTSIYHIILMVLASRKIQYTLNINWYKKLKDEGFDFSNMYHAVIVPYANEGYSVLEKSVNSIAINKYPKSQKILVLATEKRITSAKEIALKLKEKYSDKFLLILITEHDLDITKEIKGKASNENYAARELYKKINELKIDTSKVIVTSADSDSIHNKQFLAKLTYVYSKKNKPEAKIYQPIPIFYNNIWEVPFFSRIVATFSASWQMSLTLSPHRFINFSCYSINLETLNSVDYWEPDIIPEDERIYWKIFFKYGKDLEIVSLFLPVFLDAISTDSLIDSIKAQYVQIRRWAYGAGEFAFSFRHAIKNKEIPLYLKFITIFEQIRKAFEWAMLPLIIMFGFSIPIHLNPHFAKSIVAYTLSVLFSKILTILTIFMIALFYIEALYAPKKPDKWSFFRKVYSFLQVITFPFVSIIFSAVPAIEAQTRLIINRPIQYIPAPKKSN